MTGPLLVGITSTYSPGKWLRRQVIEVYAVLPSTSVLLFPTSTSKLNSTQLQHTRLCAANQLDEPNHSTVVSESTCKTYNCYSNSNVRANAKPLSLFVRCLNRLERLN